MAIGGEREASRGARWRTMPCTSTRMVSGGGGVGVRGDREGVVRGTGVATGVGGDAWALEAR